MTSLENQIFTWKDWDQTDTASFDFYDCTIVKDFGPLKKGEKYAHISIEYEKSLIFIYTKEYKILYTIKISLKVESYVLVNKM